MRKCAFCKRPYKKGSEWSFHRFPTDIKERNKWLQNMKALNWSPKERDYLCSEHFDDKCVVKHFNRTSLKCGSVPTIFEREFEVMFTSPTSKSMDTSSSASGVQSSKQCEVKRLIGESILEDIGYRKDANTTDKLNRHRLDSTTDELKRNQLDSTTDTLKRNQLDITTDELKRHHLYSIRNDHTYGASPTLIKSEIEYSLPYNRETSDKAVQHMKRSLKLSNARVKALTQQIRRLKTKVANLKSVINEFNDFNIKNKVSNKCIKLEKQYDDLQTELFNKVSKNTGKKRLNHDKYSKKLRAFAINLHFYSPKAYNYVRKKLNLALPHPRLIRSWYT